MTSTTPPLQHFALLTHDEQVAAVHRLVSQGWTEHDIARMTGLHLEQVRRWLAEHAREAEQS